MFKLGRMVIEVHMLLTVFPQFFPIPGHYFVIFSCLTALVRLGTFTAESKHEEEA